MQVDKYPENVVNPNFDRLLKSFNTLVHDEPPAEKIKDKLVALQKEAKETFLTPHQKDAIYARCENYLNGNYGSTSRKREILERKSFKTTF